MRRVPIPKEQRLQGKHRHPERSEAESKDPAKQPTGRATEFLDFAVNDASQLFADFNRVKKSSNSAS